MSASKEPGRVPRELIDFFERKGLRPTNSYRELWGEEHKVSFAVAQVMETNLLEDIRQAVIRAHNEGVPFREFVKDLTPAMRDTGWFAKLGIDDTTKTEAADRKKAKKAQARRLHTIYQTNLRQARAHGQWERIQRRKKVQPYIRYRLGPSKKHRVEHVAFDGLVYPVDHPFWQTHMPMNGWGCNCWVEALTSTRAQDAGISTDLSPELFPPQTYRDPRTGVKKQVPYGIDPGFEFPPGLAGRLAGIKQGL